MIQQGVEQEGVRLCVATTWEDALIDGLDAVSADADDSRVYELFGALDRSIVGSGREAAGVPAVTEEEARSHIALARSHGMRFNYLLNASCMGNTEYTPDGHGALLKYLGLIQDLGVDWVTITIPYLVSLVKREFPGLKVNVSTINHVDSLGKARFWEDLGADRITVSYMINRDFPLLQSLVEGLSCEIEVMANESCLFGCPLRMYHYNMVAHGSQPGARPFVQYPFLACSQRKLCCPAEILRARWIRPEDMHYYQDIGIRYIKLAGREKTTDWLIHCTHAYLQRHGPDDLGEIIAFILPDVSELTGVPVPAPSIRIDNAKLDGFLEHFRTSKSRCEVSCGRTCHFCEALAKEVVSFEPPGAFRAYLGALNEALRIVNSKDLRWHLPLLEAAH